MKFQYFISDLHLTPKKPELYQSFYALLDTIIPDVSRIYILGDLFDYWVDNEIIDSKNIQILERLKQVSAKSIQVYFIVGNRDFLISKALLKKYNINLLDEPYYLNDTICLMHGDSLCTSDYKYQLYKKIIRSPKTVQWLHHQSIQRKIKIAKTIRSISSFTNKISKYMPLKKPFAVSNKAILKQWKIKPFDLLIHGHTHLPNTHTLKIHNHTIKRIVLGDWGNSYNVLRISGEQIERFTW